MASAALASFSSLTISPKSLSHSRVSTSSASVSLPSKSSLSRPGRVVASQQLRSRSAAFVPKYSDSDAPVLEAEAQTTDDVLVNPVEEEAVTQAAKREEIFAVVMIGSRQYIVFPGRFLYTQRLKGAEVNSKIILNKVLLVGTKTSTWIGKPVVQNAAVHAVVEEQGLDPKVVVFKYKKKKNYRRNIGHRQPNTRIRITGITGYENSPFVTLDS
uniref:50S ribosomal protein L21, chloroplastic n=1 Tax=Kalanchoe fedtschenkoi TaxID=63787 RepID=A0A7N0UXS7_KALFE